jgi:hypothetical protein
MASIHASYTTAEIGNIMAKGQMRSNKEAKKPKAADKAKKAAPSSGDPVKAIANPIKLSAKK